MPTQFYLYTFTGPGAELHLPTTVKATDVRTARRLAMIERWGEKPDHITPHAPDYNGTGLDLIDTKPV